MAKSECAAVVTPKRTREEVTATKLASSQRLMNSMRRAIKDLDAGNTVSVDDLPELVSRKRANRQEAAG